METEPPWLPSSFGFQRLLRTHVSEVFIGRSEVLKSKQAVCLPFVDHRQLAQRSHSCFEELRLNRRLSHSVYKGVRFLLRSEHGLQLGDLQQQEIEAPAAAVEAFVCMRRLEERCSLAAHLESAEDQPLKAKLRLVAEKLAEFHRGLVPLRELSEEPFLEAAQDNLRFYQAFEGEPVWSSARLTLLDDLQRRALSEHRRRLRERSAKGMIRDGHGDLRLEHIFFEAAGPGEPVDGLQIIDCIEFNASLRCQDVLNDLAFLLMELDFERRGDLVEVVLKQYQEHFPEACESELLALYKSYRALVRAKVEHVQGLEDERHRARAARFLGLASRYLLGIAPTSLILFGGPMGVGKSSVARALAEVIDAEYLSSDELRNEMLGVDAETRHLEFGAGRYSEQDKLAVYHRLLERAEFSLRHARPVVVDATFSKTAYRDIFRGHTRQLQLVMCHAEEECLRKRLQERSRQDPGASDGREALLSEHLRTFEWPTGEQLSLQEPLGEAGIFALARRLAAGAFSAS